LIAGGVHQKHAALLRIADGCVDDILERRVRLAEAHVDDVRSVVDSVPYRVRDVLVPLIAIGDSTHDHDACVAGNAVDTDVVAALRSHDAGDTRAVRGIRPYHIGV